MLSVFEKMIFWMKKEPFFMEKSLWLNQNNTFLNHTNHFNKEFILLKSVIFKNQMYCVINNFSIWICKKSVEQWIFQIWTKVFFESINIIIISVSGES